MGNKNANRELVVIPMPNDTLQLEWGVATGKTDKSSMLLQEEIFTTYTSERQNWLLFLGFSDPALVLPASLDFWRKFSDLFVHHLRLTPDLEELRHLVQVPFIEQELTELLEVVPAMTGGEYVTPRLLASLWLQLNKAFATAIKAFTGSVANFIHRFSPGSHLLGRIYFHLVENKDAEDPFAFLATYSTRMGAEGQSKHLPLKYALQEYQDDNDKLLELLGTVYEAARESELIAALLESNNLFYPLAWDSRDAYTFLQEVPLYEEAGILCRIPNWWQTKRANVHLKVSLGEKEPALVGIGALLDFTPRLMLGEEEISADEIRRLLAEVDGLAFIKNKWVAVDRERLEQTLAAYEEAQKLVTKEGLTLAEAMRWQLQPQSEHIKEIGNNVLEVENGQWLQSVFSKMSNPGLLPETTTDDGFLANLRPYQEDGLRWLCGHHSLGFGCCLADDMGLGKTVQILAFLNVLAGTRQTQEKPAASLLIIPASLLAHWDQEIKRFCPEMRVFLAHPDMHKPRKVSVPDKETLANLDLVITTYALAQRYDWLLEHRWQYVILDEAQAIKNPATKQTRRVKEIPALNRIIMTGTPVENRLSDLWSLFDFINPGLLGTIKEFASFSKGLADHPDGYGRLRRMISPFMLRRLKSDKSIISDLPDKVEMKTWASLSRKQAVVYQQLVDNISKMLETADGIQRRGMILAALTKFKQICNHPDQYAGVDGYGEKESGKFARLREICTIIYEKRERVLVFTQFKELTNPLARFLETVFEGPGLILHGSVPVGKRKKIIEQFQSNDYVPFMVLSLKAGGVGLNLTRANHVIHFDRWWNPAVENQATDRVFRIGQQKKVMVHKFITKGTLEEKIDEMLTKKAKLSADVVAASGESWLTEMENKELANLFSLTS
jgi:SNF2 family DNA or RNA helicase